MSQEHASNMASFSESKNTKKVWERPVLIADDLNKHVESEMSGSHQDSFLGFSFDS